MIKWNAEKDKQLLSMWNDGADELQCAVHFKTIRAVIRNKLSEFRQRGLKVRNQPWHRI